MPLLLFSAQPVGAGTTVGPVEHHFAWAEEPRLLADGMTTAISVRLPASVRRPADNGDDRLEVEFNGPCDAERLNRGLEALGERLPLLDELVDYAAAHAPEAFTVEPSALWLTGMQFLPSGEMSLLFDFGDLDLLVLNLSTDGRRQVRLVE